jgi:transcriptional regulator with XRE-family HTH domain
MGDRSNVLRSVMHQTGITQSELSRLSGVHQPSISQFLSDKVELSDEQLDRLLSCMGYQLEIIRQPVTPDLTRSERRSWKLHRELARYLTLIFQPACDDLVFGDLVDGGCALMGVGSCWVMA